MSTRPEKYAHANAHVVVTEGQFCDYRNERYYRIDAYDRMATFFMSIVSADDHWLFLASNGG
ncbi:MAG: hypothetical protein MUQ43_11960, partial [Reinekea forsetii]|nr:hypothetical protein [Reinekea forsetii]